MRNSGMALFEDRPAWREQTLKIVGLIAGCILLLIYTSIAFKYVAGLFAILGAIIALQRCMWHYLVTDDVIQSTQGLLSKKTPVRSGSRICEASMSNRRFFNVCSEPGI